MSSSDLTSSDSSVDSKAIEKEDLDSLADSIDASLDAILSEAKETAAPVNGEVETAPPVLESLPVLEPPPAVVEVALAEPAMGSEVLTEDLETPLPVIVDEEEPSYKAFADMVAPTDEDRAAAQAELDAHAESVPTPAPVAVEAAGSEPPAELSAEPESGEILDADELIDSMTPAPELVENILAKSEDSAVNILAKTEESTAYTPPPPSDEEILDHVKLPPGSTPMPMPLVASLAAEPAAEPASDLPGASLEDDQTVISPMPPMPEPSVSLPPPRRMTSAWAAAPVVAEPSILLAGPATEGVGSRFGKMVNAPRQFSVVSLAGVALIASALGGLAMKMFLGSSSKPTVVQTTPVKAEGPVPSPAIAPIPAAQPEKVAEKAVEKSSEKPAALAEKAVPKPAPAKPVKVATKPAAQTTHIALAAPAQKPAPAAKKPAAAPAAKPKKAAANGAGWVDPFGQ